MRESPAECGRVGNYGTRTAILRVKHLSPHPTPQACEFRILILPYTGAFWSEWGLKVVRDIWILNKKLPWAGERPHHWLLKLPQVVVVTCRGVELLDIDIFFHPFHVMAEAQMNCARASRSYLSTWNHSIVEPIVLSNPLFWWRSIFESINNRPDFPKPSRYSENRPGF